MFHLKVYSRSSVLLVGFESVRFVEAVLYVSSKSVLTLKRFARRALEKRVAFLSRRNAMFFRNSYVLTHLEIILPTYRNIK